MIRLAHRTQGRRRVSIRARRDWEQRAAMRNSVSLNFKINSPCREDAMRQYLGMFAAMILMASGVAAHAEPLWSRPGSIQEQQKQTNYDPAKVSDSLKALYHFGSASTTKALNANTVTLLTGTIGGTYVQFGADLASVLDDDGNLRVLQIIGRGSVQSAAGILFLK